MGKRDRGKTRRGEGGIPVFAGFSFPPSPRRVVPRYPHVGSGKLPEKGCPPLWGVGGSPRIEAQGFVLQKCKTIVRVLLWKSPK